MESIKSVRRISGNDPRWSSQVLMSCNQCGEPTPANEATAYVLGLTDKGCTCQKCMHAYSCFRIIVEQLKASRLVEIIDRSDDKKREEKVIELQKQTNIANQYGSQASSGFRTKYGHDWREQMARVMPNFEVYLSHAQGRPEVYSEIRDSKKRGFVKAIQNKY